MAQMVHLCISSTLYMGQPTATQKKGMITMAKQPESTSSSQSVQRFLFIGNSHTYFNDMPHLFARLCEINAKQIAVFLIAHGGKGLDFHKDEPEVRFNLLYSNYDFVVLQHVAHPFGPEETFYSSAQAIDSWIRFADAQNENKKPTRKIAYMTWTQQGDEEGQPHMAQAYQKMASLIGARVAPVGAVWQRLRKAFPALPLYGPDGQHASPLGSLLAACVIYAAAYGMAPLFEKEDFPHCFGLTDFAECQKPNHTPFFPNLCPPANVAEEWPSIWPVWQKEISKQLENFNNIDKTFVL